MPLVAKVKFAMEIVDGKVIVRGDDGHSFEFGTFEEIEASADEVYQRQLDLAREITALNFVAGIASKSAWQNTEVEIRSAESGCCLFKVPAVS